MKMALLVKVKKASVLAADVRALRESHDQQRYLQSADIIYDTLVAV